jgi:tRNA (cmo5U34)-methyltransferase
MTAGYDTGYAPETWAFDEEVTRVFEDMLARSIPDYLTMRELVWRVGRQLLGATPENALVVDLGCSVGGSMAPYASAGIEVIGVDESGPMLKTARERFANLPNAHIAEYNLRDGLLPALKNSSPTLYLSILTAMFLPIQARQALIGEVYASLAPGGALILVEKILGPSPAIDSLMVRSYYDMKREHGYSDEEIERKRLSLQDVLIPLTTAGNEEMLADAGFGEMSRVWQWMNFAGWIAIK